VSDKLIIQIDVTDEFFRNLRRLSKKYRRVEADVDELYVQLEAGERPGERLQGLDPYVIYKVRVASRDMQRGKSGGFRIIYYIETEEILLLVTIYSKTEYADIDEETIRAIIKKHQQRKAEENTDESSSATRTDDDSSTQYML
jgi:mRNA-degrading endonuclease RelE of RelBE toxin-antitoxin system